MSRPRKPAGDYEVGYRRPPKETRFQKGQSGNPNGRPKGSKNLKTDLIEELEERILVREGGRARTISKQRAMVKTLMNRAIKGDARSAKLLVGLMLRLSDQGDGAGSTDEPLNADEYEILEGLKTRLRRHGDDADAPADDSGIEGAA